MSSRFVRRSLAELSGLPVWGAAVAGSMLTLQFGSQGEHVTKRGVTVAVGERALHVQCMWRIMKSNEIIAGSDDCLCASEKTAHIALNEKVRSAIGDEPKVCAIRDLRPPDLLIKINRIITIEILTSAGISGSEIEAWRVLAGPRHFVVMSDGSAEDDED